MSEGQGIRDANETAARKAAVEPLRMEKRPYDPEKPNAVSPAPDAQGHDKGKMLAALRETIATSPIHNDAVKPHFERIEAVISSGRVFGGRNGTRNPDDIKALQTFLSGTGFGGKIQVNGKVNDLETTKAIKAMQKAYGLLPVDGVWGENTQGEAGKNEYNLHLLRVEKARSEVPAAVPPPVRAAVTYDSCEIKTPLGVQNYCGQGQGNGNDGPGGSTGGTGGRGQ